jgi:hypothetical protein
MTPAIVHEQVHAILCGTDDGDGLDRFGLWLVQEGCNGHLNETGLKALAAIAEQVKAGTYRKPWFHGVENLTQDHEGYVYWRGKQIEHFSYRDSAPEAVAARRLGRACVEMETAGLPVTVANWFAWTDRNPKQAAT